MVAIVTGNGVGLGKSSSEVLGQGGQLGLGQLPGAAGNAYVNATTGNLIIQRQDELLIGRGPDIGVYQTYNSQGTFDFDNNDNWQVSLYRQLSGRTGTLNAAGSTITRTAADGTPLVYTYDSTSGSATFGKYVNKDGSGSYDTLTYTSGTNTWVWQDGNTRIKESYAVDPNDSTKWRITSVTDLDNNSLTYTYSTVSGLTTLIDKVTSANGEITQLIYNATKQLTQINVINSSSVTTTRIRYTYESTATTARLTSVSTDLTPADGSIADGKTYTTTYTYDGTSKRIASITNSDGSKVSFTYETSGSFRLLSISDYVTNSSTINNTTTLNYTSATTTTVTNTNNAGTSLVTTLTYDTNKQLTNVQGPSGSGQNVSYTYNSNGDVTQVTDSRGNWTKYTYDSQGNQLTQQDNLGNTITRTYGANNQLLSQTVYSATDSTPADNIIAASGGQTTRYVYSSNGKNQLRYQISAEGRVTEYRYNSNGQLDSTLQYTAGNFDLNSLPSFIQDFSSNSDGFNPSSPLPTGFAVVNGALQITSTRQANSVWTGVSTAAQDMGTRFSIDVSTQVLSAGLLSAGINAGAFGTSSYRRLWVTLDGSNLILQTRIDGTAVNRTIGTVKANTNYVVEALTDSNGMATLYFYEKGQSRDNGYAGSLDLGGSRPGFALETVSSNYAASSTATTNTIRVDNFRMQKEPQESDLTAWVGNQDLSKLQRTDNSYDARGQLNSQSQYTATDNTGAGLSSGKMTTQYTYDAAGNLKQKIDARGVATTGVANDYLTSYYYDGLNRLNLTMQWDETGFIANVIGFTTYTDASRQVKLTLANGLVTTSTYDLAGRLLTVQKSDSVNTTAGSLGTISYAYDKLNNLRMVTDELGNVTYYLYDSANRKVGEIDENKNLTEWVYNNNGQVIRTIQYKNTVTATLDASTALTNTITTAGIRPAADTTNDRTSYRVYDQAGRLSHEIDALGYVTEYQYDGASRLLRTVEYNTVISAANLDLIKGSSTDVYGINGSIKGISGIATTNTLALTADATNDRANRNLYDNDGKLVGSLDAEGYLTEYVYDKAGRQTQKIRYATVTTSTNWATGNLATLKANATAVSGDTPKHQTTNYIYDAAGQLTGVVDAENFLTEYQYDLVGNKTQEIRYATSITYVAGNTVVQSRPTSNNEDQKITNTYDANNRILSTLSNTQGQVNGLLTNYSYDNVGKLTQALKTFTGATSAQQRVQRNQYDSRGNLIAELNGEGVVALLALGSTPTQAQIDTVWNTYGTRYSYDLGGRLLSKLEPNGTNATGNKTLYYYDNEGKLTYTINALGEVSQTIYNSFDQVAETRRYNTRIASATLNGLTGGADTAVASAITGISAGGYSNIQVGYDKLGQAVSTTDELNNINSRTYNAFGELNNRTDKIDGSTNVVTSYQYDRKGLLKTTTEDASGINRITQAVYDAFGRVTQTTDGRNNTQQYQYDRLGREVVVIDGLSKQVTTTYDAFSRVLKRIDRNNTAAGTTNGVTYTYNSVARTMTMTTAENISVVTTSNEFGEVVQVADGRGSITKYSYNTDGQLLQTVEDSGSGKLNLTSGTTYDTAGRVWKTTDAKGTVTQYSYDPTNRVLSKAVDPTGLNLTSNYRYDAQGRQIWAQDAKNIWTRMDYDKKGQLTKVVTDPTTVPTTDANGVVTGTAANAAGLNLTTSYTYNARGKKMTVIEGDGTASARTTQYVYDKLGRLTSTIVDPGTNKLNLTTSYTYDKNDNVVLKTDANGNKTVYTYDANNRLVYTVDALGYITKNEYDANGNIVKARAYKTALAPATLTTLQGAPATTAVTPTELGDDRVTRYGYDKDNRLTYTTNAEWFVTRNEYDANGNVVKRTSYVNKATALSETGGAPTVAANTTTDRVEQTVYDAANRATYSIDALNYVTANSYDANGNVVSATRYANAMVGTLTTNTPPQILASAGTGNYVITSSNDQVTRYSYDKANRRTFSMEANGSVTQYDYDKLGQTLKVTRYANALVGTPAVGAAPTVVTTIPGSGSYVLKDTTKDQVVEQKFDAAGRKTEAIDAEGKSTKTEYNAAGDIVKVTDALNNVGYFYTDAAGRVTLQVDPEGAVTQTQYDGLGNATQVLRFANKVKTIGTATLSTSASIQIVSTAPTSGNSVYVVSDAAKDQKQTTEYDKLGQAVTVKTWTGLTSGTATTDYYTESTTYGAFGEALTQTARNGLVTTYTYNKQGNKLSESFGGILVRNAANNGTITLKNSYTYNAFGNLLSKVEADGALTTRTTSYANDRLGRQVTATQSVQTTTGTSASAITQKTYDARGNLVAEKDANNNWTYTYYDKQDRRIASINANGVLTSMTYDALGNKTSQTTYANKLSGQTVNNLPSPVLDPANDRTIYYTYDAVGRELSNEVRNMVVGTVNSATNTYNAVGVANLVNQTVYDANGNIIKTIDANGNITRAYYNLVGQKVAEVDAAGYLTTWVRNSFGNVVNETKYANKVQLNGTPTLDDGMPQLFTEAPSASNLVYVLTNGSDRITTRGYDQLNRLVSESQLNVAQGVVNATNGQLTQSVGNVTTTYQYDGLDNVIRRVNANSAITDWAYDAMGRQIKQSDPVFTDNNGNTAARSVTDKEYDGINNLVKTVRRGTNNASEADDQIVRYSYGVGGRLISETDALGNITQYEYDLNGNINKKILKNRINADGAIVDDVVTYNYDGLNQQLSTSTKSTSESIYTLSEVKYNSFGNVTNKRSYTNSTGVISSGTNGWDEYTEYDQAGRVFKTNSEDGVSKIIAYDANGNATIQITSTDNSNIISTTQNTAASLNALLAAPNTLRIMSVYDVRNQLTTTLQASMDSSKTVAAVTTNTTSETTYTPANPLTGSVTSSQVASNPVAMGSSTVGSGNVGWSASLTPGTSYVNITTAATTGATITVPNTDYLGTGSVKVEVSFSGSAVTGYTMSIPQYTYYSSGSISKVLSNTESSAAFSWSFGESGSQQTVTGLTVRVIKATALGDVVVANQSWSNILSAGTGGPIYTGRVLSNGSSTPAAKKLYITGQPPATSQVLLSYRTVGATGTYTTVSVPQLLNTTGTPVSGMFAFDWNSIGAGNYEYQYSALDGAGNLLNVQRGTFNTNNAAAPTVSAQTPVAMGGIGRSILDGTGLRLLNQGTNAAAISLRYRAIGTTYWSAPVALVKNSYGVDSFYMSASNFGLFSNGSTYEAEYVVTDANGAVLRVVSNQIVKDASGNVSLKDAAGNAADAASLALSLTKVRLGGQPANTAYIDWGIRAVGSTGAYTPGTRIYPNSYGQFDLSIIGIATGNQDVDIRAYATDGELINHNQANILFNSTANVVTVLSVSSIAIPQSILVRPTQTTNQTENSITGSVTSSQVASNPIAMGSSTVGSGNVGWSASLTPGTSYVNITTAATTGATITVPNTDYLGTGSVKVEVSFSGSAVTGYTMSIPQYTYYSSGSISKVLSNTESSAAFSWSFGESGSQQTVTGLTVRVIKATALGDVVVANQSWSNILSAGTGGPIYTGRVLSNGSSTPAAKKLYITGQPPATSQVLLSYRTVGATGTYTTVSVPQLLNTTGTPVSGMFAFDWNSIGAGNYEYQYSALDGAGNLLNVQRGTFNTNNAAAPTVSAQTPVAMGGIGRSILDGTGLRLLNQGTNAAAISLRYRAIGTTYWSAPVALVKNSYGVDSFYMSASNFGLFSNGSTYEAEYVVTDANGAVLRVVSNQIAKDASGNVSLKDGAGNVADAASLALSLNKVRLGGQPANTAYIDWGMRAMGSTGAYMPGTRIYPNSYGQFDLSIIGIAAGNQDIDIRAYNASGVLLNHSQADLYIDQQKNTVTVIAQRAFTIPQVTVSNADYAILGYRLLGSNNSYTLLPAKKLVLNNGVKEARIELPLTLPPGDYEYQYTSYLPDVADPNNPNNPYDPADPTAPIYYVVTPLGTTSGKFTIGVGASTANARLDWVLSTSNSSASIQRRQSYNAFGEVISETDGRGNVSTFSYNAMGKLTQKVDASVSITLDNGTQQTITPTTTYTYDAIGRMVATSDANGNLNTQVWLAGSNNDEQVVFERHADGGLITRQYDVFGNKRAEINEINQRTDYTYDLKNQLTRVDHAQREVGTVGYLATRTYDAYSYDSAGQRIKHTNSLGDIEKAYYDSVGRITQTKTNMGFSTTYSYTYSTDVIGLGGANVNGWTKTVTDAVGRTTVDKVDMFDRTFNHKDLGNHTFTYTYNYAGWLTSQTGSSGQNISYDHYANGYIKSIHDKSLGMYTYYEYDSNGNKSYEGYAALKDKTNVSAGFSEFYQQATISYDALNRIKEVVDPKAKIEYQYDAVGNRRSVKSTYYEVGGNQRVQDYWYKYDSMNRFLITMGSLSNGLISKGVLGSTGVEITYNLAGQRVAAANAADNSIETYTYAADGYLIDVKVNGTLRSRRTSDALGRTTNMVEYGSDGVSVSYSQTTSYDKDNRTLTQQDNSGSKTWSYYYTNTSDTTSSADGAGELARTFSDSDGNGNTGDGTIINTYYGYEYWDEAKVTSITADPYNSSIKKNNRYWKDGYSDITFDVNGHINGTVDWVGKRNLKYVSDAQGLILLRDEITGTIDRPNYGYYASTYSAGSIANKVQRYYYVDGRRVGDVGNDGPSRTDYVTSMANRNSQSGNYAGWRPIGSADFDQNYEPISPTNPGSVASSYTVRSGDTLQSISRTVWGDAALWYLIADTNGLSGSSALTANQSLIIPNKVTNVHNNAGTFRPYNPGEAMGDINPTIPAMPKPPKKKGCGGFAQLIVMAVTIAVSVMAPYAAPISAALGNLAGQATANILGVQKGFDFKSFATSVATAGITEGLLGPATNPSGVIGNAIKNAVGTSYAAIAARAVVGNVINQGVGNITGSQKGFSWSSVAAAGVGAVAGYAVGKSVGGTMADSKGDISKTARFFTTASQGVAAGTVSQLTQIALDGKGKLNWNSVAINGISAGVGALAGYDDPKNGGKVAGNDSYLNMVAGLDGMKDTGPVLQLPKPDGYSGGWAPGAREEWEASMAKTRTGPPIISPAELAIENAQALATQTADRLLQVNQLNQTLSASIRGTSAYEAFKIDSPRYTGVVNIGRNLTQAVTAPFTGIRALAQDAQAYVMGQQRSVITGQFYPESGVLNGLKSQGLGYVGALAKDAVIGTVRAPRDLVHGLYQGNADEIGSGGATIIGMVGGAALGRLGGVSSPSIESIYQTRYISAYERGITKVEADLASGLIKAPAGQPEHLFKAGKVDLFARDELRNFAAQRGDGADIVRINQRLYLEGNSGKYRIPDVYFPQSGTILDGTLGTKTLNTPQIIDFRTATGNGNIGIVRPQSYGGSYWIKE